MSAEFPFLVSQKDLLAKLGDEKLKIIDASWYLPAQNRNAIKEYNQAHIPGAVFFDQDKVVEPTSALPHTIPTPSDFADAVGALGISHRDEIIVYDGLGIFTAPRVWWLLKTMGAENVKVLNGGFDNWKNNNHPVSSKPTFPAPALFEVKFNADAIFTFPDMQVNIEKQTHRILDARSDGRFYGTEAEPREGMRSGHMPGAINIPVFSLSEKGELKPKNQLEKLFTDNGVELQSPSVTTCGSGVTAAVISFTLANLGHTKNALYDGSWSEWGSRKDTKITKDKDGVQK